MQNFMRELYLEGNTVYLVEVKEKYFPYIITWRNDPINNRYLNQPFLLDMEKQRAWYQRYCTDYTQGLLIVIDKQNNLPFATMGWTNYISKEKICITGRLLVGDRHYRGSPLFVEATLLFADYMYGAFGVEICYAHIVRDNIASIRYHEKYGFQQNMGAIRFPNELLVNGMQQVEYTRTKEAWISAREYVVKKLHNIPTGRDHQWTSLETDF